MRPLLHAASLLAFCGLLGLAAGPARADDYPTRPVRLIVGFASGGINDVVARILAEHLTPALKQAVVVENRPGAGATVAADLVAKSKPDGYTLLLGSVSNIAMAPTQYKNLPYDPAKDFSPIAPAAGAACVLIVNPKFQAQTVRDLVALAKQRPGHLVYGSGGQGSSTNFVVELFKVQAGVDLAHTAYKGDGPSVTDVVAGHIPMAFPSLPAAMPFIKSGQVKPIAVSTATRSSFLPELPTVAEAGGLPEFEVNVWLGVFAPPGTPREIVSRLNAEISRATKLPAVRDRFTSLGAEPLSSTPEQFASYVRSEIGKWAKVAKAAKMVPN